MEKYSKEYQKEVVERLYKSNKLTKTQKIVWDTGLKIGELLGNIGINIDFVNQNQTGFINIASTIRETQGSVKSLINIAHKTKNQKQLIGIQASKFVDNQSQIIGIQGAKDIYNIQSQIIGANIASFVENQSTIIGANFAKRNAPEQKGFLGLNLARKAKNQHLKFGASITETLKGEQTGKLVYKYFKYKS